MNKNPIPVKWFNVHPDSGSTPFGFYDDDSDFQSDTPNSQHGVQND